MVLFRHKLWDDPAFFLWYMQVIPHLKKNKELEVEIFYHGAYYSTELYFTGVLLFSLIVG